MMGMYDTLICDYPLPVRADGARHFQTKSMDCLLERYRITAEGALLRSGLPWAHTGAIHFYDIPDGVGEWVEYRADFVAGVLTGIVTVEDTRPASRVEPVHG